MAIAVARRTLVSRARPHPCRFLASTVPPLVAAAQGVSRYVCLPVSVHMRVCACMCVLICGGASQQRNDM